MDQREETLNFYKKVFMIAIPIALQSLITIGVNMLDTMMVGKLGKDALSATSLANSFISVFQILCMGLGMGASVLVSRYWGMERVSDAESDNDSDGQNAEESRNNAKRALKQTVCLMLRFNILFASLFAIATWVIPGLIMRMYTDETPIIALGEDYFKFSILTYFFVGISLVTTIVLRSVGQVLYPLIVSIGAFAVNLAMNYIFIFGKCGLPEFGVTGAALASTVSILLIWNQSVPVAAGFTRYCSFSSTLERT